jgi:hypothetical protein
MSRISSEWHNVTTEKAKGSRMKDLTDYSGKFDPDIKYENFSKDFLVQLLRAYADYLRKLDGFWYLTLKNKIGDDEAFACDIKVWEKMCAIHLEMIRKLYKINSGDVAALLKAFQMSPWRPICQGIAELKSPRHGIVTITSCPTLLALENEGKGGEEKICQQLELQLFIMQANFFNPQIQVRTLKVPPRTEYSDCCCQWEFWLEPKEGE